MRRWIREHVLAVKDALGRLVRHSPATVLNVLVMGFALALPAGLHAVLKNVSELLPRAAPEPQLTLFLRTSAASGEIEAISARLQAHAAVARARFVSKDKALDDLKQSAGLVDVVDELGRNPLPDAFIVSARKDAAAELEGLKKAAEEWPGVEYAQLDSTWARQLGATLLAGRVSAAILAVILAVALLAVTFNTIRLQILGRREEIEVSKLIGATNAYIRRPFLYFGALQSLLGGLFGWGLIALAIRVLEHNLGDAVGLVSPRGGLLGLAPVEVGLLCGGAAVLGWCGAWLSATFFLRRLEP